MNILHIVEDYSLKSGGLRTVIKNLDYFLNQKKINSYVLSTDKESQDNIFTFSVNSNKFLYSKKWPSIIKLIIKEKGIEIIHIHGTWTYLNLIAAKIAVKNQIPFIISPHGMYQEWIWKKSKLKKLIYFNLFSKKWFKKANFFHSITEIETKSIKKYFKNLKIIEIPNLISIESQDENKIKHKKEFILFLGRIDEVKGLEILIKSFNKITNKDILLKIAGGDSDYKNKLKILIENLNLVDRVSFLGQVKGERKSNLLKNAWAMVTPSFSEAIGMVNLESALHKTPCITTFQTGINYDWSNNGGILINPKEEELTNALNEVLAWNEETRLQKGIMLNNFVRNNYSWELKLNDWINLYKSI